jgi:hypothetical protein
VTAAQIENVFSPEILDRQEARERAEESRAVFELAPGGDADSVFHPTHEARRVAILMAEFFIPAPPSHQRCRKSKP